MKKTLEALAMLGVVAGGSGPIREALNEALKEVAGVRKAAKFLVSDSEDLDGAVAAMETMRSIAADER